MIGRTALFALALAIAACSPSGVTRGVVIEVDGDLTSVASFVVLTDDGARLTVVPDPALSYDFPLSHLRDHLRTGEPVEFRYEDRDGQLVLTSITDG